MTKHHQQMIDLKDILVESIMDFEFPVFETNKSTQIELDLKIDGEVISLVTETIEL